MKIIIMMYVMNRQYFSPFERFRSSSYSVLNIKKQKIQRNRALRIFYVFLYMLGLFYYSYHLHVFYLLFIKICIFNVLRIHWNSLNYLLSTQIILHKIQLIEPKNISMKPSCIVLALILVLTLQQAITIRNRGCKSTDSKGVCTACSTRYFLDREKICQPVNPNCNNYDQTTGACLSCYPGFGLLETTCLPGIVTKSVDPNCNQYEQSNCVKCSFGYFLSKATRTCTILSPLCRTSDPDSGACRSCYAGYEIQGIACIKSVLQVAIPNCNQIDPETGKCRRCSIGFYFDITERCIQTDPSCLEFNVNLRACVRCYVGYSLNQNALCLLEEKTQNANPYCAKWNGSICLQCAVGSYFNQQRLCVTVNPNCKTVSASICTSCYNGFEIVNNTCVKSKDQQPENSLCAAFDANNVCLNCSKGSFLNERKLCAMVNPLCLTFDNNNGRCQSCFTGYTLNSGNCIISNETKDVDPFCQRFLTSEVCEKCSDRYYIGPTGFCMEVNPFCNRYNLVNGRCFSCYPGYALRNDNCFVENKTVSDDNCKTWRDDVCVECAFGAYFSPSRICTLADPLCRTFDNTNGACLSCYDSFELIGIRCIKSEIKDVSDVNCAEFSQGACTKCSVGFIFNSNRVCSQVSSDCKTFVAASGLCSSCYFGFDLANGICVKGVNDVSSIDKNCAKFAAGICVQCSKGFYFGPQSSCLMVDPLCNTFDALNGQCLTCFPSFILSNGSCIRDSRPSNCVQWLDGTCISCAFRNVINKQGNCEQVNINCNTYSALNGLCTSCYAGYSLQSGRCSLSESQDSCSKINEKSECIECGKGSYLKRGKCITIDAQCKSFDLSNQICLDCYEGFSILNGACQISKVDEKFQIQNCFAYDDKSSCIKCYDRYYLSKNVCEPVDIFCRQYDDTNGNCISCFSIFNLANGKCTLSQ